VYLEKVEKTTLGQRESKIYVIQLNNLKILKLQDFAEGHINLTLVPMFHPFGILILDVLTIFSLHQSHANRYKRYIVPVLSVFMDFYVRVFVRVFT
jgi:hypothetical protein